MTTRASKNDPWCPPVNLGPSLNTPSQDWPGCFSPDGSTLHFSSSRAGGQGVSDLWQVSLKPVVDFNGDGEVDLADMSLLEANLEKSNPLYDIGPFPWGDGVVDEKDMAVLIQSMMTPSPHATGVSPSVALSWITPSFAESFDIYLGTSADAVTNADRSDPCGVLVSHGQMGTTYDPNGLLEYGQTYYWRVDLVTSGATPTIYKGLVTSFTTRPYAYPIKPIKATASSFSNILTGPEKTIDGSGLDTLDQHSTSTSQMWLSKKGVKPIWIQYEFDQVYNLHQMWVWNQNQILELDYGLGAKEVTVEYSTDDTTWTTLAGVPEFAQGTGKADYAHNTTVDFGGIQAKYVRLTVRSNWAGGTTQAGLSEVRFFYIPE